MWGSISVNMSDSTNIAKINYRNNSAWQTKMGIKVRKRKPTKKKPSSSRKIEKTGKLKKWAKICDFFVAQIFHVLKKWFSFEHISAFFKL